MNFSNSSPPFASIARCDARFSGSVVISTNGKPTSFASARISLKAFVAYPFRCFHGTTEYPMWPRHVGGSAVVPCCHLRPIFPANSPSHIQRRISGSLGTTEPSGRVIGGPSLQGRPCWLGSHQHSPESYRVRRQQRPGENCPTTNPVQERKCSSQDVCVWVG